MSDDDELTELVNTIRSGGHKAHSALEQLISKFGIELRAAMRHTIGRTLGRTIDPSDIFLSVMFLLFQSNRDGKDDLSRIRNGRDYIDVMLKNRVIDYSRKLDTLKRNRKREVGGAEICNTLADPSPSPSEVLIHKEKFDALMNALSPQERIIAEARMSGKSWAKITDGNDGKINTIGTRFRRTLNMMARLNLRDADEDKP